MHKILLQTTRQNFVDTCFWGSVYIADNNSIYESFGDDTDNICFMRSLAKPMQTSILFDTNIISEYSITNTELAIFSGSHAGSDTHIKLLKNIFKKNNLRISDLSICPLLPLDLKNFSGHKTKTAQQLLRKTYNDASDVQIYGLSL